MSKSSLAGFPTTIVALLLLGMAIIPIDDALAQLPPLVTNTGASCLPFPPMPFVDPSLQWNRCSNPHYDFDACNQAGNRVYFRLRTGPGSIDTTSGLWTWTNIPDSSVGQTALVQVYAYDSLTSASGPWVTMSVNITRTPPTISSGCQARTGLTGQIIQSALTSIDCDPVQWHASQILGQSSSQYDVDASGKVSFSATDPGIYQIRVVVSDGADADSCDITYTIHGGGSCCVGNRGNVNGAGIVDGADLAALTSYLTSSYVPLGCYDAANVNGSGLVDSSDLALLVAYLTVAGVSLPLCP